MALSSIIWLVYGTLTNIFKWSAGRNCLWVRIDLFKDGVLEAFTEGGLTTKTTWHSFKFARVASIHESLDMKTPLIFLMENQHYLLYRFKVRHPLNEPPYVTSCHYLLKSFSSCILHQKLTNYGIKQR